MNKVLSIVLAIAFFMPSAVEAQNARLLQESLSTKDLLAVGYVDLQAIDAQACLKWVKDQQLVPDQSVAQLKPTAIFAKEFLDQITKAGAEHALVLVRQEDLRFDGRPLFAVSVAPDQQPQKVLDTLKITLEMLRAEDLNGSSQQFDSLRNGKANCVCKTQANCSTSPLSCCLGEVHGS